MTLLRILFATVFGLASATIAGAQDYPARTVKIIVGFPAGTSTDIIARIYASELEAKLRQPFIVENVAGAASNLAAAAAARAAPDGHTLFMGTVANSISQSVYKKLSYNLEKDFDAVAIVGNAPTVLIVSNKLGVNSVADLVALAKSTNSLTYASAGVGTAPHLSAELFAEYTGANLTHVPYRGNNQAITDLLTDRISLIFAPIPTVAGLIQQGEVKAIAVTSAKRTPTAPTVPTLAESGLGGFETGIWYGVLTPKGTPTKIIDRLATALNEATATRAVQEKLIQNGADPQDSSPAAFTMFIHDDIAKWQKIVTSRGISVD